MGLWTGDFDGNGDVDICVSCKEERKGYWFENADGMPDIMGKHYERGSALEVWYNTLIKPALPNK